MTVEEVKHKIEPILKQHGVKYAALFGSRARGESRPESDFDILVRFSRPIGLFEFTGLAMELEETLKAKVDLVTEDALSPYIKDSVLNDLRAFYEQG